MTVTIWHNAKCATSRKVLDAIRKKSIEPQIVDDVKSPRPPERLKDIL